MTKRENEQGAPKQSPVFKTDASGSLIIPEGVTLFFITELMKIPVELTSGLSIGRFKDIAVKINGGPYPEATHVIISRSWGRADYWIPWSRVTHLDETRMVVNVTENLETFTTPVDDALLVCDRILDKKIIDMEDREVEVVYDVQVVRTENKLILTHVDASRAALLRRMKLGFVNRLFFGKKESPDLVPWEYVHIPAGLDRLSGEIRISIQREKLRHIHPVDLADIIEELGEEERVQIFDSLDTEKAADTLEEIEPRVQRELISSIRQDRIKDIFGNMTPVQIADLFSILPAAKADRFMEVLDADTARQVHAVLTKRDEDISHLVSHTYLGWPGAMTIAEAFERFRSHARDMDIIMYIYIIDDNKHLDGVVDIRELLQAEPEELLQDIMVQNVIAVEPGDTREDIVDMFNRYSFRALPVVDNNDCITGVIRFKDVFLNQ